MQPADVIRADRLADLVCHEEQMLIWEVELLEDLLEFLKPTADHEAFLELRHNCRCAIRRIVESAFAHPEIMGIPK